MVKKIRVLVVDDSAFIRKALRRMIGADPLLEVTGEATNGHEALSMARQLRPDVITLDVQMPELDGLTALRMLMREQPTPIIMISALTREGSELTFQALESGAIDFIDKSSCHTIMDFSQLGELLVGKIRAAAGVDVGKLHVPPPPPMPRLIAPAWPDAPAEHRPPTHLVVIGASTGGPQALEHLLAGVNARYGGAIIVVQHMPAGFTRSFAERLHQTCKNPVHEAVNDEIVYGGQVYIAPGGFQLTLRRSPQGPRINLGHEPRELPHCPSVDVLFRSVAEAWSGRLLAIVLTGMGQDGAEGVRRIKEKGGTTLAEAEESCVVYGMPRAAVLTGCVDRSQPLYRMVDEINRYGAG